jgi:acyl dehydratase
VQLRLGVPNFAGDTLKLTGIVRAKDAAARIVEVAVTGANRLGEHVAATVRVALP